MRDPAGWPFKPKTITIDENWNPDDKLEVCDECKGTAFTVETSGPLTDWVQCDGCHVWYPFAAEGATANIFNYLVNNPEAMAEIVDKCKKQLEES